LRPSGYGGRGDGAQRLPRGTNQGPTDSGVGRDGGGPAFASRGSKVNTVNPVNLFPGKMRGMSKTSIAKRGRGHNF